jgi:Uncharacterized protein conserved in bacteria
MIVDTSALIAIVKLEPDGRRYETALESSPVNRISAATYLEVSVVIDGARDPLLSRRLDEILAEGQFIIEPVTEGQARIARAAYRDFGKGSGHPAGLNFGDCFSYALARTTVNRFSSRATTFVTPTSRMSGDPRSAVV